MTRDSQGRYLPSPALTLARNLRAIAKLVKGWRNAPGSNSGSVTTASSVCSATGLSHEACGDRPERISGRPDSDRMSHEARVVRDTLSSVMALGIVGIVAAAAVIIALIAARTDSFAECESRERRRSGRSTRRATTSAEPWPTSRRHSAGTHTSRPSGLSPSRKKASPPTGSATSRLCCGPGRSSSNSAQRPSGNCMRMPSKRR